MRGLGLLSWWRQQLADLVVDRGRIGLVTFGVVWGTLSLTVVLAFGEGFQGAMHKAIASTGDRLFRLSRGATTKPHLGLPAGRAIRLSPGDAEAIRQGVPTCDAVSVEYSSGGNPLVFRGVRHNANVHGVDPEYGSLRIFEPLPGGRFINEVDVRERRRVAFVGNRLARQVFGSTDPVGQSVLLWAQPFTVIGVMRPKIAFSNYEGYDKDKIAIPATTFRALRGWRYLSYIVARVRTKDRAEEALAGIYRVLARRHGFDPEDRPSLTVANYVVNMRDIGFMVDGMRGLMSVVAILGMCVALVGVANVMYVMVEERCREFGIQMALGARRGAAAPSVRT